MTTLLVLGATGFLGSHVLSVASREVKAARVVGVSRRFPSGSSTADQWRTFDLERSSADDYRRLLEDVGPHAVINCAGRTGDPYATLRAMNVDVVDKLLAALSSFPGLRLVHFGSAAEYGTQPSSLPIQESAPPNPVSDYGKTKLESTALLAAALTEGRLSGTILRVFNPVGRGAPPNSVLGRASRAIREARSSGCGAIQLGPLGARRDFVAAADVATAAVLAARAGATAPILNVGRGEATSTREMVDMLVTAARFDGRILEVTDGSDRSSSVDWQQADISLLRRHLQWVPTTPLADAVSDAWVSTA